jgi:hypothetical protein
MKPRVKLFPSKVEAYHYMYYSKEKYVVIVNEDLQYCVVEPQHARRLLAEEDYLIDNESEGEKITREDLDLLGPIYRFRHLEHAVNAQNLDHLPTNILVGDDDYYWLLLPADSKKLFAMGYGTPNYL